MAEKMYKANVYCTNCSFSNETEIPTGCTIEQHHCPTCGCKTLRKKQDIGLG